MNDFTPKVVVGRKITGMELRAATTQETCFELTGLIELRNVVAVIRSE